MTQTDPDIVELSTDLRRRDTFWWGLTLYQIMALVPFAGTALALIALPARDARTRGLCALLAVALCGAGLLTVVVRVHGHTLLTWLGLLISWRLGARRLTWVPERPAPPPACDADEVDLSALFARMGVSPPPDTPGAPAAEDGAGAAGPGAPGGVGATELAGRHTTQMMPLIPDSIADGMVTMPDGHRFGVLSCGGRNLSMLPAGQRRAWDRQFHQVIVGLAHPIKFVRRVRRADVQRYLDRRRTRVRRLEHPTLRQIMRHDVSFMEALTRAEGGTNATTTRTYVSIPAPDVVPDTEAALRVIDVVRGAGLPEIAADHARAARALDQRAHHLAGALRALGVPTAILDDDGLADLIHNTTKPRTAPLQPLGRGALVAALPSIGHIDIEPHAPSPLLI